MRTKGNIASWNDDKGYGFITPLSGGKRIFVHVSAFSNRNRRPKLNGVVTYSVSTDKQGRPCAANATLAGDTLVVKAPKKRNTAAVLFAVLFLAAMGVSILMGALSGIFLVGYMALSMITFMAYAFDKSAARRGASRVSEGTLLLFGLAGGWPGAIVAQELLRHKSKKAAFRSVFWVTVLMNCAALLWAQTEIGREIVQDMFG